MTIPGDGIVACRIDVEPLTVYRRHYTWTIYCTA